MTRHWEPGVQYNLGDKVEYKGHQYNIIQPHRSQGDWTPDITPALWGRVPYHDSDDNYKQKHHEQAHNEEQQCRPPQQWNQPPPPKQRPEQGYGTDYEQKPPQVPYQTVQVQPEEQKKSWYDLSPERKKQLEIGGGIAAGLGLLGAGFAAYKHHEKSEEEEKAMIWGAQNWLQQAQSRTQEFYQHGPRGPCTWVLAHGKQLPQGAIVGGREGNDTLYVARAFHEGGVHPGKASNCCPKGAIIGYGNDEVDYDTYEVLVGDMSGLRWVDYNGKLNVGSLGATPVEAGREKNGDKLYVAQGEYKGETICGKVKEGGKDYGAILPKNDKEHSAESYRVLCYA